MVGQVMAKLHLASLAFSAIAASTICLAGMSANADEFAVHHIYGPSVVLGNMIREAKKGPTVVNVSVEEKTRTIMSVNIYYNTETCQKLSDGAWTINAKPKHGTDTLAPYTFKFTCNGVSRTYTGAGIYYTSSGPASKARHDETIASWNAPSNCQNCHQHDEFKITITP